MSLWKRGRQYWTDFTVASRRYRKRLGTTSFREATRRERELIEEAGHGRLAADEQGPKRLSDAVDAYLAAKRIRCSPRAIQLAKERLSIGCWSTTRTSARRKPPSSGCTERRAAAGRD